MDRSRHNDVSTETPYCEPRHRVITRIRPLYIDIGRLVDHHNEPLRVDISNGATVLTEHEGTSAEDIIPHFLARLSDPDLRSLLDLFGCHATVAEVRADWRKHLSHLLWMTIHRDLVPPQARWT